MMPCCGAAGGRYGCGEGMGGSPSSLE